jgi:septation ring formation regulator EzrA
VSILSQESPLYDSVGKMDDFNESHASVLGLVSKQAKLSTKRYEETVIDYIAEWEAVVTKRVDAELAETGILSKSLDHYEAKVKSLREKVNALDDKIGKTSSSASKLVEKLKRNEEKLETAFNEHERSASKLCDLMEEVTARGYKDLYPLIMAICLFESERSRDEAKIFAKKLPAMMETLTDVFNDNDSKPK